MTELLPFQKEGVQQIYRFAGRTLLADEMGLGKTIQTLYWLYKIRSRRPAVIVTPASLKYNWQSEAQFHFGMRAEILEGKTVNLRRLPGDIVILNYDILKAWLPFLLKHEPKAVVFDEAHFIKNRGALRTQCCLKLSESADSVIALSGTPLTNRPVELWTILKAVRPDLFPSFSKYAWRYCKPRYTPKYGWLYNGATHLKELNQILRSECMIRRKKREVLKDLPSKTRRFTMFRINDYSEYNSARDDFLDWLEKISPSAAKRAKRAEAITRIGYLMRLAARLKYPWTVQWIKDFFEARPGKKLVAFTMHTAVLKRLEERFENRCLVIDGSVNARKKHEAVRAFSSNPKKDLFLIQWKAGGVGLNLVSASDVVALDFPWTPGDLIQGEARVDRIGQKHEVTSHYLALAGTIEEDQIKFLRRKSKILDEVLDGKRDSDDLDIFNEMMKHFTHEQ